MGGLESPDAQTCLAGGRNWLKFLGVDDHEELALGGVGLFPTPTNRSANGTRLRITTRPHWHCCAFIRRVSCHCQTSTSNLPARTSGNCSGRYMLAYTKALQFGAEKVNLPTQGQPCLLVGSVVELREEMKCYVSFTDKDSLQWCGSSGGIPSNPTQGSHPQEFPSNTG